MFISYKLLWREWNYSQLARRVIMRFTFINIVKFRWFLRPHQMRLLKFDFHQIAIEPPSIWKCQLIRLVIHSIIFPCIFSLSRCWLFAIKMLFLKTLEISTFQTKITRIYHSNELKGANVLYYLKSKQLLDVVFFLTV